MSLENILLDTTITIIDKDMGEKLGQLRYIARGQEVEIFDTYVFPEHRGKKMMSGVLKKIVSELKVSGISKISLKYFNDDACVAWEKMGFVKVGKNGRMELDLQRL